MNTIAYDEMRYLAWASKTLVILLVLYVLS